MTRPVTWDLPGPLQVLEGSGPLPLLHGLIDIRRRFVLHPLVSLRSRFLKAADASVVAVCVPVRVRTDHVRNLWFLWDQNPSFRVSAGGPIRTFVRTSRISLQFFL